MPFHTAANLSRRSGLAHGFFGRAGGVSQGVYASLNCGPGSRDDPAAVAENRARCVKALAPGARLVSLAQIHSATVHTVDAGWDFAARPDGDAMVTALCGVMLGILTADCVPVLFADSEAGVIGAAHAGWKGALGGVTDAAIAAMEGLGAKRSRIAAAIGPCISQANYETGPEFRARFDARYFDGRQFDLEAYVADRLASAGIATVARLSTCTYAREDEFFSYRRATHRGEKDYGRQISAIVL
ncbi:MAG TPA: peptidoglycan editing factor PgeF [Rhizomicrobium sp.]|nr:peptidoglycan editing factor PgeF [Rhizomicrobium sp.]